MLNPFIFLFIPLALLGYFLSVRFLFRKWRYRWAVWLWGLTYWVQLPFFYGRETGSQLFVYVLAPLRAWTYYWSKAPGTALLLLLVPSVPASLAFWVQHRRYTRPPKPAAPVGGTRDAGYLYSISPDLGVVVVQQITTATFACLGMEDHRVDRQLTLPIFCIWVREAIRFQFPKSLVPPRVHECAIHKINGQAVVEFFNPNQEEALIE